MSSPHSCILSIHWCLLTSERCGTPTGKNALEHSRDWHTELLRLCTVFERVEANVFMAVSLGQKLKNAPRLLSLFIENNIGLRSNSTSRVEVENLRSRHWKGGGASEREMVASLFPPLGPTQAWRKSLRMGNFLNGHEPIMREIVFSCHDEPLATSHDGGKQLRQRSHNSYSHRMFIAGTSKDLQVASNIISSD
jgi:Rab3 GTPase-activating protein catalytic subunit